MNKSTRFLAYSISYMLGILSAISFMLLTVLELQYWRLPIIAGILLLVAAILFYIIGRSEK